MRILKELEAEDFLAKQKFLVAERKLAKNEREVLEATKKIGYPVVLKVSGILHKTDIGGVKVDLRNDDDVKKAYNELSKISKKVLVQKFISGESVMVGLKRDEAFGHAVSFGAGGVYTEVMKDVSFRICPIDENDANDMIKETRTYGMFAKRGKKINFKAIEDVLMKLSNLSKKHSKIIEMDINPLIVNKKEAVVVDARIVFD